MKRDWLWDRNISSGELNEVFGNPNHPKFFYLAGLLLSRKNNPREVFQGYLKPRDFCRYWPKIKRHMRKDSWNNPRIDFWQAIYEKLLEKYRKKGVTIFTKTEKKPTDKFCLLVGKRIEDLRKQKGLTQKVLSKRIGVSQQMISRIESGKENISLLTLKKVIERLGASLVIEEDVPVSKKKL